MVFDRSLRVAAIPTLWWGRGSPFDAFVEFYRAERARLEGGGCPVFRHGEKFRKSDPLEGGGRSVFRADGLFRKSHPERRGKDTALSRLRYVTKRGSL